MTNWLRLNTIAVKVTLFIAANLAICASVLGETSKTAAAKTENSQSQTCAKKTPSVAKPPHVLLIGLDGFGAYAWEKADIPNLKAIAANGALTLNARTVLPSISAPNWGTHLMGAGPELHGWTSNREQSPPPLVKNERGVFPGIFPLVRDAFPNAKLAVFYDWDRIHDLVDAKVLTKEVYVGHLKGKVTRFNFPRENPQATDAEHPERGKKYTAQQVVAAYEAVSEEVGNAAAEYIEKEKPLFSFVYFGAPDETGHKLGHDTPGYYATLKRMDASVGRILEALKKAGIEKETVILVISDHGGINKNHGGKTLLEVQTPWVISGSGIRKSITLQDSVVHTDTAPTIARIFGLSEPQVWRGKPVSEAFEK